VADAQELVSLFSSLILICYRNGDSKLADSMPTACRQHATHHGFRFYLFSQYFEELTQTNSLYRSIESVIVTSTTFLRFIGKT
jgi:hypothetical protein